jgi:hypothetical protein
MSQPARVLLVVLVAGLGFYAAHYVAHYGNEP